MTHWLLWSGRKVEVRTDLSNHLKKIIESFNESMQNLETATFRFSKVCRACESVERQRTRHSALRPRN
jgi:hypothetical protein